MIGQTRESIVSKPRTCGPAPGQCGGGREGRRGVVRGGGMAQGQPQRPSRYLSSIKDEYILSG